MIVADYSGTWYGALEEKFVLLIDDVNLSEINYFLSINERKSDLLRLTVLKKKLPSREYS